ncbi:hypothetical protein GCM10012275_09950 [Longimycelium tulufanense]|uniref:Crp/Fnr family transcriptional regulator n=1 Tax=Longimycelium tulufanense TaxID=907463 RepID=A0A8J3C6J1_9PSEU|nr:Crp/Fnr family transcriptional regulator [Longimycelium tulufanense]GGM40979.1 hypothetical protein GCM10012275_09950 [Longimycelium tulufanense]
MGGRVDTVRMRVYPGLADELRRVGLPTRHRPGRVILRQGEPAAQVLLVETGRVTVVRTGADGTRLLLALRGPGHLAGEAAAVEGGTCTDSVIAVDACVTFAVGVGTFRGLLRRPRLAEMFDHYLTGNAQATAALTAELSGLPVREKVARTLLHLHRAADPPAGVTATVPLTSVELAHALAMARSSLTATLAGLRRQGVVDLVGGRLVVVDTKRLAVAAGIAPA